MKHTDEYLKEIFSKKLGEHESHVPNELWNNIASQLPQATTAANSAGVAAKAISAKLVWTAAVVAVTVASVVTYLVVKNDSPESVKAQTSEPAVSAQNPTSNQKNDSSSTENLTIEAEKPAITEQNNGLKNESVAAPSIAKDTQNGLKEKANSVIPHSIPIRSVDEGPIETFIEAPVYNSSNNNSATVSQSAKANDEIETQALTANYTVAPVNKEDLRYFFFPQFTDGKSYTWYFGDGTQSSELSPVHRFEEEGIHQVKLTVTNSSGRTTTSTQSVVVFKPGKIDVPNIFTPNNDGQNDYFDINEKSHNVNIQNVMIMSNSGSVFQTSDAAILWDGNDQQGNPCLPGAYQYFISGTDKEGNPIEKKGSVRLSR